jgi:hypothetical protein
MEYLVKYEAALSDTHDMFLNTDLDDYDYNYKTNHMSDIMFGFYVGHIKWTLKNKNLRMYSKLYHIYTHINFTHEQIQFLKTLKLKPADEYDWN